MPMWKNLKHGEGGYLRGDAANVGVGGGGAMIERDIGLGVAEEMDLNRMITLG
jgi:hypothetical protein